MVIVTPVSLSPHTGPQFCTQEFPPTLEGNVLFGSRQAYYIGPPVAAADQGAHSAAWSPDSTKLAFLRTTGDPLNPTFKTNAVGVYTATARTFRTLWTAKSVGASVCSVKWLGDSKSIIVTVENINQPTTTLIIDAQSGETKQIRGWTYKTDTGRIYTFGEKSMKWVKG